MINEINPSISETKDFETYNPAKRTHFDGLTD